MPILQEQKAAIYKDVLYADFAAAKIGNIISNNFQTTSYYIRQPPFHQLA
ncbi:MAG: hypothetical protein IIB69_05165 [Proteobacteria bacterium]|nr:hypothetical protein [Pseudomonadota bacterium]